MVAALGERPRLELRGLDEARAVTAAVLVLNGAARADLARASDVCGMLAERCLLVAVDGGLKTCRAGRRRADLWVGDADSVGRPPDDIESVLFDQDKEFSDLAGALIELRRRKVQIVSIAGLLGGRLDHEWANVQELATRARGFTALIAPSERATVLVTRHGCRATTVPERTVSLFALSSRCTVTLAGTRWELERRTLRQGSLGLSNRTGTDLDLIVHAGTAGLVFLPRPN